MKKVLISIPNLFGGGAERVASIWANQLIDKGYDVALLLSNNCEGEYALNSSVKKLVLANTYEEYKQLNFLKRNSKIRKIIKGYKPNVIINFLGHWQIILYFATFGLSIPTIETVRVSPWHNWGEKKLYEKIWLRCFKKAKGVILQTAEQGEYFSKKIRKKCTVISNPYDAVYDTTFKQVYNEEIKNFIAIGRISRNKNFPLMINAFADLIKEGADITLSIYGAGETEPTSKLQQLISCRGVENRIKLMGRTDNIPKVLTNADAFIMTSSWEGMPNALLEAMVAKLPCISTDCRTGPKDMIDDRINGFLAKTDDLESVKDCIKKVLELNKFQAQEMGEKAREKIFELCSKENSLEKLIQLIENTAK